MRRLALLVLLAALPGCGDDDGASAQQAAPQQTGQQNGGLSLSVSFSEPLRSGQPATWTLEVRNGGAGETTLMFRSGKDGDVSLLRDGREAYRWSATRFFSQAMREVRIGAGDRKTYTLEETTLSADAGDYELVAELDSEPAPPPARRSVKVEKG
jgi:hypothetical protein